jgi:hypothetical protein
MGVGPARLPVRRAAGVDPLAAIANTRRIERMSLNGKPFDPGPCSGADEAKVLSEPAVSGPTSSRTPRRTRIEPRGLPTGLALPS